MMEDFELRYIDPEEIEDLLREVETSFSIQFLGNELVYIKTFGQLCDHIVNKITLENYDDCTSQQAFYKLRKAISESFLIDHKTISRKSQLAEILPAHGRWRKINMLEKQIGCKLDVLSPPYWVTNTLVYLLVASFGAMFIYWQIALPAMLLCIGGLWLSDKIGNVLESLSMEQIVEKMTREHYLQSRRNRNAFNKKEVENLLTDWFCDKLGFDKSQLHREAFII